jgi:hypothetical protein
MAHPIARSTFVSVSSRSEDHKVCPYGHIRQGAVNQTVTIVLKPRKAPYRGRKRAQFGQGYDPRYRVVDRELNRDRSSNLSTRSWAEDSSRSRAAAPLDLRPPPADPRHTRGSDMFNGPNLFCTSCGHQNPSWTSRCACGSSDLVRQLVIVVPPNAQVLSTPKRHAKNVVAGAPAQKAAALPRARSTA